MLIVLLILWTCAILGFIFRNHPQKWVNIVLTFTIWIMLFFIGAEVGGNKELIDSLSILGVESTLAACISSLSCCLVCLGLWTILKQNNTKCETNNKTKCDINTTHKGINIKLKRIWAMSRDSLIIIGCVILGILSGMAGIGQYIPEKSSFYCLCILIACVGFGIGQNKDLFTNFKNIDKRLIFLPIITAIATWLGCALMTIFVPRFSLTEWLAVGSGFGYYSLSSILITEVKGAELGTIALLYNIIRELIALIGAPMLAKWFGPLATISVGGATTADTTLPSITKTSGDEFVPLAIFHGIIMDLSVPFLVPFLISL